jgi:hypothetical protein
MLTVGIPVLHISSSERAEDFYCGRLGFRRSLTYRIDDLKTATTGLRVRGRRILTLRDIGTHRNGGVIGDELHRDRIGERRAAPAEIGILGAAGAFNV